MMSKAFWLRATLNMENSIWMLHLMEPALANKQTLLLMLFIQSWFNSDSTIVLLRQESNSWSFKTLTWHAEVLLRDLKLQHLYETMNLIGLSSIITETLMLKLATSHPRLKEKKMNMTMNTMKNMMMKRRMRYKDKEALLWDLIRIKLPTIRIWTSAAKWYPMRLILHSWNLLEISVRILALSNSVKTVSLSLTKDITLRLTSSRLDSKSKIQI